MSTLAPAFPLATAAVDSLRGAFERRGRDDFSLLWSGEAAALAREADAGELTQRLWRDALACAAGCATRFRRRSERPGRGRRRGASAYHLGFRQPDPGTPP